MKKSSDLLKNLHKTIATCSKKNRKIFEEELDSMSKKIEEMIKDELKTCGSNFNLDQINTPLDNISFKISALQEKISIILKALFLEANNAFNEIYESVRVLEDVKDQIFRKNLENISEMSTVRKKIMRSLKKDKDLIKKSIKKYKWVDL